MEVQFSTTGTGIFGFEKQMNARVDHIENFFVRLLSERNNKNEYRYLHFKAAPARKIMPFLAAPPH
jgi:hypothetical protein